jgi:hypothetical protein
MLRSLIPWALLASIGLATVSAFANDPVTAQALFDTGKRLIAQEKFAEACPKFEESQRLDPAIGTHYALADCYEKAGRLASAWAAFLDVASEAGAQHRQDREQYAKARASALAPRLSRITVVVPAAIRTPGLLIQRDAETLHEAQWGVPVPVDPGSHVVTASAPGKLPWQTTVVVREEGKTLEVPVSPLADAPPGAPSGVAAAPSPGAATSASQGAIAPAGTNATPSGADTGAARGGGMTKTLAWVGLGVGAAGIVTGLVTGGLAMSKRSSASGSPCASGPCQPGDLSSYQSDRDSFYSLGTVSTISFVTGGAFAAAGVVLLLVAPHSEPAQTAWASPYMSPTGAGVTGHF